MSKTESVTEILKERGTKYGRFLDHARISQKLKDVMAAELAWKRDLWDDQRQALEMIADKIARMLNGDPDYVDNWLDIEGYARLVRCRLEESDPPQAEPIQVSSAVSSEEPPKFLALSKPPSEASQ